VQAPGGEHVHLGDGFNSVERRFEYGIVSTGRNVQDTEEETQHQYDLFVARDREELRRAMRIPAHSPETCWDSQRTLQEYQSLAPFMDPLTVVVLARALAENPMIRSSSYTLGEYPLGLLDYDPSGVAFRNHAGDSFVSGYRPGASWYTYLMVRADNEQHREQLLSALAAAFSSEDVERQVDQALHDWRPAFVSSGSLVSGPSECEGCVRCVLGQISCLRDNYDAFVKRASRVTAGAVSFETRPYISLENIPDQFRPALEAIERARTGRGEGTTREP